VRPAAPGGFRYGRFWLTQACCVIKGGPISDRGHLIKLELMAHPTYALNVVVVLPPQPETRRGYKDGYYSRPVGASFFFCVFLSSGSWAPRTYFKCRNLRADSEGRTLAPRTPASGGRLCIVAGGRLLPPPPGARRGRAHRVFARGWFVSWIGPLSLVQGLESATGNLSPLWGPGVCRMLRDKARGAWGGWIMPLVGPPGPTHPTPRRGLQVRSSRYSMLCAANGSGSGVDRLTFSTY
jgi:hypothetical protein